MASGKMKRRRSLVRKDEEDAVLGQEAGALGGGLGVYEESFGGGFRWGC